jgi:membrane protein DedA with SNARE-associated domain
MIAELLSDSVTQIISSIGYFGVFILMALESAAIPVPSELIMTFSGYLAYQGVFDFTLIVIIGAAGCLAGSVVSYWVGLKGGRSFVDKYGKYFFLNHHHLDLAEDWFKKYGDNAVFFSRMLPVVRTFISLPAGMGRYSFRKLVVFSFVGSLPWCFALAYVGFKLGPKWKNIIEFFNGLDVVIVIAMVATVMYYWRNKK